MQELTSKERISRIVKREPVDRIGLFEHIWGGTQQKWRDEGHLKEDESIPDHFNFDMQICGWFHMVADKEMEPEVIEEDDDTILVKDGNGAFLRKHKKHASTPEHVEFSVVDRAGWEEIKPLITPTPDRMNAESYRNGRQKAAEGDRFFCWSGVNVFELMHPVCGHEHMLVGMALDPDWIKDMAMTYATTTVNLLEMLFEQEGKPDGVWFYEDLGFKERPFMSPDMYKELIQPAHKLTFDFCHSQGLPVIVHSCGYIDPLIPGMVEAGMDALQVMEVKAGMDSRKVKREFGDKIALIGGIDVRCLTANDRQWIDQEIEKRIPTLMQNSGYVLHSDHSLPVDVEYETYKYFVERGLGIGTY